jgi:hypothetical protein
MGEGEEFRARTAFRSGSQSCLKGPPRAAPSRLTWEHGRQVRFDESSSLTCSGESEKPGLRGCRCGQQRQVEKRRPPQGGRRRRLGRLEFSQDAARSFTRFLSEIEHAGLLGSPLL